MIIEQDELGDLSEESALTHCKAVLTKPYPQNMKAFVKYIFQTSRRIKQIAQKYIGISKGRCSNKPMHGYQCFDCCVEACIICEECWDPKKHEKHQYKRIQTEDICSCGRENKLNKSSFCEKHNGEPEKLQLSSDIGERLDKGLVMVFQQIFHYCQLLNYECGFLSSQNSPKILQTLAIRKHIDTILQMLNIFCRDFCKQITPMLFRIATNITKRRQWKRFHNCSKTNIQATFKGTMKDTVHLCDKSILQLLFTYSIFLNTKNHYVVKFLEGLFISREFRKRFAELYTSHYRFIARYREFPNSELYQMYRNFNTKEQVHMLVGQQSFENIFDEMRIYQQELQTHNFEKVFEVSIVPLIHLLRHFSEKAANWGLQMESFKILHQLVRQSFESTPVISKVISQHKTRIQTDHMILTLTNNLIGSLSLNNQHSKKLMQGLIFMYLNEKQTLLLDGAPANTTAFCWYTLPERILGVALMIHYVSFSYSQSKSLFDKIFDQKTTECIIKELLRSLEVQEKLLAPSITPLQETISDVLQQVVRNPSSLLYDCDMLCLQMFAILSEPELFVKYILDTLSTQIRPKIMLQLVMQQSYFLNVTSAMGVSPNPFVHNAKKLYLINAYNIQNTTHLTNHEIIQLFDRSIFDMRCVSFQDVIFDIADYDKKLNSFVIKQQNQGFMFVQPMYFQRNKQLSEVINPIGQPISYDEFGKNTLLRKQVINNMQTFCYAVTDSISRSLLFMSNVMMKSFRQLWAQRDPQDPVLIANTFRKLKILQVFMLRNSTNLEYMKFFESQSRHSANQSHRMSLGKTQVQTILLEMLAQFESDYCEAKYSYNADIPAKFLRSSKVIKEIKQKQKRFAEILAQMNATEDKDNDRQCLICKKQDPTDVLWSGIRFTQTIISKSQQLQLTFQSCGHMFHKQCLQHDQFDFVCPKCGLPFPLLLPDLSKGFCFYRKQRIALRILLQKNRIKCESSLKEFTVNLANFMPSTPQNIETLIVSRLHLCTQQTPEQFHSSSILKSLYCVYLTLMQQQKKDFDKQTLNTAITTTNDQTLVSQILVSKSETYNTLLRLLVRMSVVFDSVQCLRLYQRIVSKYMNAFLAVQMYQFYKGEVSGYSQVVAIFNKNKNLHLANLTPFCRGVFYAYSLAYEDADYIHLTECYTAIPIIEQNIQLFNVDVQMISTLLFVLSKGTKPQVLSNHYLINPTIIELKQNYKTFHEMFYGKPCDICHKFPPNNEIKSLVCLECGFRFCSQRCCPTETGRTHINKTHGSSTILLDISTGAVYLHQGITIQYGHLYVNEMDEWSQELESDWENLRIDKGLESQIKRLIHTRQIPSEIAYQTTKFSREGCRYITID